MRVVYISKGELFVHEATTVRVGESSIWVDSTAVDVHPDWMRKFRDIRKFIGAYAMSDGAKTLNLHQYAVAASGVAPVAPGQPTGPTLDVPDWGRELFDEIESIKKAVFV